ncbi:MAG: hypothetical protein BRD55_05950 [Bacteroidetes bacterium SW_9_63_38]|nr:MAG: hypothetical protein BRD55_05950 [Bacteroidetes bacterium SW_9_63_38]
MTSRLIIILGLVLGMSAAGGPPVSAQGEAGSAATEQAARTAARAWLGLLAEREFEESWDEAAPLLRERVDRDVWKQRAAQLVDSIGAASARTFTTVQFQDTLRQSTGPFVILRARATYDIGGFEEHLVLTLVDEEWRVAGYRVTPLRRPTPSRARPRPPGPRSSRRGGGS